MKILLKWIIIRIHGKHERNEKKKISPNRKEKVPELFRKDKGNIYA